MGGSASYRYSKKIRDALARGTTPEEIAEILRRREHAIETETARREFRKNEREISAGLAERMKNAKPNNQRPANVHRTDWEVQNPELGKGIRLLKSTANMFRGKNSHIYLPKPIHYSNAEGILSYKSSDRNDVEKAVREIEKELNIDLGFALDRMKWVD